MPLLVKNIEIFRAIYRAFCRQSGVGMNYQPFYECATLRYFNALCSDRIFLCAYCLLGFQACGIIANYES